jgi:hypothetical protein
MGNAAAQVIRGINAPKSAGSGNFRWDGGVSVAGHVYGIPSSAETILMYNTQTGAVSGIAVPLAVGSGRMKWAGGVAVGGRIYGIPANASQILVFDVATGAVSGIPLPPSYAGDSSKWSGGVAVGSIVYGIPHNADRILALDTVTMEMRGIPVPAVGCGWCGGAEIGGKLYGIPYHASQILVLDLATSVVTRIPVPASVCLGFAKWSGGVSFSGKVYGIPLCADKIVVLDVATQVVSHIAVQEAVFPHQRPKNSHKYKWRGGVVADGVLYCIPYNKHQVLKVNLQSGAVSSMPVPASVCFGEQMWSGGAVVGGHVYGIPAQARKVMALDTFLLTELSVSLAAIGPLTLQCLDGSRFKLQWPANSKHGTKLDIRKLAMAAHPGTILSSGKYKLLAAAPNDSCSDSDGESAGPLDFSVLDRNALYTLTRGVTPIVLTVVFE